MIKGIKNIIFDLDNTLYNYSELWLAASEKIFLNSSLKNKLSYDEFFKKYLEICEILLNKDCLKNKEKSLRIARLEKTFESYGIIITEKQAEKFYDDIAEEIIKNIKKDDELIENIVKLKNNYNIFILTNGYTLRQNNKIRKLGLEGLAEVYISFDRKIEKPAAKAFENIIKDHKLKFEETLMVGDSLYYDINPAQKLGMKVCLIDTPWHLIREDKSTYSGMKVKSIKELLEKLL